MLDRIARELGVEGWPNSDQYRAATAVTHARARKLAGRMTVFWVGPDALPTGVGVWCVLHAEEFDGRTLRKCPHGDMAQPLTIFASEPNVAYCDRCTTRQGRQMRAKVDRRGRELVAEAVRYRAAGLAPPEHIRIAAAGTQDCELCGIPESLRHLHPILIVFAAVTVLGLACDRCLAS
jgi:hypothetical protein